MYPVVYTPVPLRNREAFVSSSSLPQAAASRRWEKDYFGKRVYLALSQENTVGTCEDSVELEIDCADKGVEDSTYEVASNVLTEPLQLESSKWTGSP